jgi:hypothetical protein
MRRHHRHLCVESLEGRSLMSAAIGYPAGFIGPILRDVQSTMTFNPKAPVLGTTFQANLTFQGGGTYWPVSTQWSWTISYNGFTTAPGGSGATLQAVIIAQIPGTYDITAVTTFMSTNPTACPPPQTTTGEVKISAADTATKGGQVRVPVANGTFAQIQDTITAVGDPIGGSAVGMMQYNVPAFKDWNGKQNPGTNGQWLPTAPSAQFYVQGGVLYDQQLCNIAAADWNGIPVGGYLRDWSQELRWVWSMTDAQGVNHTFTAELNTLSWSWTKVSATRWESE